MKKSILVFGVVLSTLLFSCSSSNEPLSLEVINEVEGPLNTNLKLISDKCTIEIVQGTSEDYAISFSIELKVSKPLNIQGGYSGGSPFGPTIEYRLLDANKVPIKIDGFRILSNPDLDGIANNLGNMDSKFWIQISQTFAWKNEKNKVKIMQKALAKAKFVQLTSVIQGNNNPGVSGNTTTTQRAESSSSNCDQMLEDYKTFMQNYVAIIRKYKANPTDMSLVSHYTKLASENTDWSTKIGNCASDPNFASKVAIVQLEIANALGGAQ